MERRIDTSVKGGRGSREGEARRQVRNLRTGAKESRLGIRQKPKIFLILSQKEGDIQIIDEGRDYMRKTKERETDQLLAVDIEKLSAMLSCGQASAKKIGEDAGARIVIGRRVLYSVSKVSRYLDAIAI